MIVKLYDAPNEVLLNMATFFDQPALLAFRATCRRFSSISADPSLILTLTDKKVLSLTLNLNGKFPNLEPSTPFFFRQIIQKAQNERNEKLMQKLFPIEMDGEKQFDVKSLKKCLPEASLPHANQLEKIYEFAKKETDIPLKIITLLLLIRKTTQPVMADIYRHDLTESLWNSSNQETIILFLEIVPQLKVTYSSIFHSLVITNIIRFCCTIQNSETFDKLAKLFAKFYVSDFNDSSESILQLLKFAIIRQDQQQQQRASSLLNVIAQEFLSSNNNLIYAHIKMFALIEDPWFPCDFSEVKFNALHELMTIYQKLQELYLGPDRLQILLQNFNTGKSLGSVIYIYKIQKEVMDTFFQILLNENDPLPSSINNIKDKLTDLLGHDLTSNSSS